MTENLRLIFNEDTVLTPDDTDVTETILAGTITTTETEETRTVWLHDDLSDEDDINMYHSYAAEINTVQTLDGDTQKLGTYYNWFTATLGTGTYAATSTSPDATSSVCPKGWKLPNGKVASVSRSWASLVGTYLSAWGASEAYSIEASVGMRKFPVSFILSGHYNSNGWLAGQDSYSHMWTSAPSENTSARLLSVIGDGAVSPRASVGKRGGRSVRCVNK